MNRRFDPARISAGIGVCAFLSACAVGPDYRAPDLAMPETWSSEPAGGQKKARADDFTEWWASFDDPLLTDLIEQALADNPDRKSALARVREARARRGVSRAGLFPAVDASGSASTTDSEDAGGQSDWRDLYSAGLDASWEIDVFGGVRRSVEAANAAYEARQADYFDILVSLAAETGFAYVDVRALQERLRVTRANLAAQERTYDLTRWRAEAGMSAMLDVEQARSNLAATRAQIPLLESDLAAALNSLSILLGQAPGTLAAPVVEAGPVPATSADIVVGVPADLLRQRPDIRSAERDLAAQSARIGVAEANLYPRFQLFGSITGASSNISDVFSGGNIAETLTANITAPVFQAGRLRRNVEIEDAVFEQTLAAYESTVLQALKEVEDALAAVSAANLRTSALLEAVDAAQHVYALARQEYESGLVDFDQVLDAQRTLLSQEDNLVQSRSFEATAMISLYKALGGGWTPAGAIEASSRPHR